MRGLHAVTPLADVLPGEASHHEHPRLEVWGVHDVAPTDSPTTECEQIDPLLTETEPEFWSIYEHVEPELWSCICVDDFASREEALRAAARLGASRSLWVYDFTREGYRE